MRGVPRDREAISRPPSSVTSRSSRPDGAVDDAVQLAGGVVVELCGEPEPVTQGARQQAGPGRRTDDRERRDLQRDGGRTGTLADDDVDAEVLHRHVEELFGRPRHAVDLVDEQDVALVDPREDRGEVSGVLDRRAARDAQRCRELVGDDHRDRGLAESGRAGQQHVVGRTSASHGRLEHQRELLAYALLADQLVERARTKRRLERAVLGSGLGDDRLATPLIEIGLAFVHQRAFDRVRSASRSTVETSGVGTGLEVGGDPLERGVGVTRRPAEPEQRLVDLVTPRRRTGRPRGGDADAVLELDDDALGTLAADAGHRGQGREIALTDRLAEPVGVEHGQHRLGDLGADAAGGLDELEHVALVGAGEAEDRQRVLAHHHRGRQLHLLADAQRRRWCSGVHMTCMPTPPTSMTAEVRVTAATGPRTWAIIGLPCRRRVMTGLRRRPGAGLALPRARCGRSPAPGRRRRRPAWAPR